MTRTEDVVRVRSIDTNYLNARIEALEKYNKYLEQIIDHLNTRVEALEKEVQKLKQKLEDNE